MGRNLLLAAMAEGPWKEVAVACKKDIDSHSTTLHTVCDGIRDEVKTSFQKLRDMLDARERELLKMVDESEEQEKGRVLDKRKERIDACCETLGTQTDEMTKMMSEGKFDRIQETTQLIKENEIELKTLAKNIRELTFTVDAQVAIQSVEARIPQVAITSGDGAPGIFFTGNGATSPPVPHVQQSPALLNQGQQGYGGGAAGGVDFGGGGAPPFASPMPAAVRSPYAATPSGMSPISAAPSAIYINGLPNNASEQDIRDELGVFGEIEMINSRHIATGGFAFVFYTTNEGAAKALEHPRIMIKGKTVNVLAKKQIVASSTPLPPAP